MSFLSGYQFIKKQIIMLAWNQNNNSVYLQLHGELSLISVNAWKIPQENITMSPTNVTIHREVAYLSK